MEVELTVEIPDGTGYTVHLKGDNYIIQSALAIYTKQLLVDGINFKLVFRRGEDQT